MPKIEGRPLSASRRFRLLMSLTCAHNAALTHALNSRVSALSYSQGGRLALTLIELEVEWFS